ncbi:cytochrome c biogenesis protein DipZ [Comamonas sp. Tr-654]|uniref:cytochrome c biogenesis protein DipZ n=1 Tax=Comamonas sp. Tr-654 TaxID=2608341 RepID=UPI0014240C18|nr:cytochrome c biogenesis protein DipZ [Comamonas sp. Tr-654]NIF82392.1 cytochrome c biogenesis protein DipZ [Comamonas sp. Tr-654]
MLLIVLAYLGGVLTIVSPCILPVLPFVFSRANQPFVRSGLPLLAGMALTFAVVASLAAVGGGWVVAANQYGRWLALALVAVFGLTLLLPHLSERLTRPLVTAGSRLSESVQQDGTPKVASSVLLGVATGLLWAPCAGPILGLILTGAALQGANTTSSLLLLAYAAGAATSMAAALLLGGRVFAALKRSLGAGEWVRRALGAAMLAGVAAIALGIDTGVLARLSTASTGSLEQKLVERLNQPQSDNQFAMRGNPGMMMQAPSLSPADGAAMMAAGAAMRMSGPSSTAQALPDEGIAPPLNGATQWLNSKPLGEQDLRGKVVLVDFWTYSCINCLRTLPYVKAWAEKYRDQGLVVIGVHAPEFAFERDIGNVSKAMKDLGISYPVAVDNQYAIWRAFRNQYWPAHYFIDATGRIRHHHFGEGGYAESERVIQQLLKEAGSTRSAMGLTQVDAEGVQLAANMDEVSSPETYLGYERAENFASTPKAVHDRTTTYLEPQETRLNAWGLAGQWMVGAESATLAGTSGRIVYRFKARDLHLVLSPGAGGKPVRFKVSVDGKPPGDAHGVDVAADGSGTVTGQRLYQLVRQSGAVAERTFSIEFLDSGVSAYAFTFG